MKRRFGIRMTLGAFAALLICGVASAQNLDVKGTTTSEGNAYFYQNVGIGTTQPSDRLHVNGNITLTSPDTGIYGITLYRTNENGRAHWWKWWHMNSAYGQDSLQLWEYQNDSLGASCGTGNPADGAMCSPRLSVSKGGALNVGGTLSVGGLTVAAPGLDGAYLKDGTVTAAKLAPGAQKEQFSAPLASDQSTGWNYANVTGLNFAIAANDVVSFEFVVPSTYTSPPVFKVIGPASPAAVYMSYEWHGTVSIPLNESFFTFYPSLMISVTSFGAEMAPGFNSLAGPTVPALIHVRGLVRNGANAGTVQLQYHSGDGAAATIKAGAFVRWAKLN